MAVPMNDIVRPHPFLPLPALNFFLFSVLDPRCLAAITLAAATASAASASVAAVTALAALTAIPACELSELRRVPGRKVLGKEGLLRQRGRLRSSFLVLVTANPEAAAR